MRKHRNTQFSDYKKPQSSLPPRNPVTYQQHRREVFRQISLPMIIGLVVLCALAAFVTVAGLTGSALQTSKWADISVIWLILPALVAALIFLALVAGLIYLTILLLGKLPLYARIAQDASVRLRTLVRRGADKAVEPILRARGLAAGWRAFWNR